MGRSKHDLDETTFDDVAMILLFFFLVLVFFVFAKKYNDIALADTKTPKPVEKTKQIKTHNDTDGLIYVGSDQSIHLRNLGGVDDARFTYDITAIVAADEGGWASTEQEETSAELFDALRDYYAASADLAGRRGGRTQKVRFFVASDSEGKYGVLHQVTRALNKLKKAARMQPDAALQVDVRPCPSFADGLVMAEQLHTFNACVNRICAPGDTECLQTFVHMESCRAETGVKRNEIIKQFCRWPRLDAE